MIFSYHKKTVCCVIVDDLIQNTKLKVVVYTGQLDLIVDTLGKSLFICLLIHYLYSFSSTCQKF